MSRRDGHLARARLGLPSPANRTLPPPLYVAADLGDQRWVLNNQTGGFMRYTCASPAPASLGNSGCVLVAHSIIPAEFLYTGSTVACGWRIPNTVTGLRLNTPPPFMSTCMATPYCPQPFWSTPSYYGQVQPSYIVRLTQQENLAVTSLPNQNPLVRAETFRGAGPLQDVNPRRFHRRPADHTSVYNPVCSDVQCAEQEQGDWSQSELEAANTLSCFVQSEQDQGDQGDQDDQGDQTFPDSVPHLRSSSYTKTQHGSVALPARATTAPTQKCTGFGCIKDPRRQDVASADDGVASGGFAEVRGQTLSDSEGEAVSGLLSLRDMWPVDKAQ